MGNQADSAGRPSLDQFHLVQEINRRRLEIADQMAEKGDVSMLSMVDLLDTLLILSFDEACSNRAFSSRFWGSADTAATGLDKAVTRRLQKEFGLTDNLGSRGRGTMAAHGQIRVGELWHKVAHPEPAE